MRPLCHPRELRLLGAQAAYWLVMKNVLRLLVVTILSSGLLLARPAAEAARIEFLLSTIKSLQGAVFVRSGQAYDGATAEAHLRMKLTRASERVQTAEQFIEGIASKSYLTGKPYQIRFGDGRTVGSGPFLTEKLKEFRPQPAVP